MADFMGMMKQAAQMQAKMQEMQAEMMPMMMPGGMDPAQHARMMRAVRAKNTPGLQSGEVEGSLHDAVMATMPGMKMMPEAMEPGKTPKMMVDAMLAGWRQKHGSMPDIAPMDMSREPHLPPPGAAPMPAST